jgi:putative oxidoreductase
MYSLASLLLRVTFGGLLAGHGAQKLWGKFDGPGLEGTAGFMESMGMKPGHQWALMAGASELGGGVLTALGMLHPVGPLLSIAAMGTASLKAHAGKPIWATSGGAELPVTNMAIAGALLLAGPGWLSVDKIFRTRAPFWMVAMILGGIGYGLNSAIQPSEEQKQQVVETAERALEVVKERVPHLAA